LNLTQPFLPAFRLNGSWQRSQLKNPFIMLNGIKAGIEELKDLFSKLEDGWQAQDVYPTATFTNPETGTLTVVSTYANQVEDEDGNLIEDENGIFAIFNNGQSFLVTAEMIAAQPAPNALISRIYEALERDLNEYEEPEGWDRDEREAYNDEHEAVQRELYG
jgi:hypothetical protein